MKKFLMGLVLTMVVYVPAFASVNVLTDGNNLGPAQDINIVGASVTGNAEVKTLNVNAITSNLSVTGNTAITGTFTSSNANTLGMTVVSGSNTLGTEMCTSACVFCIDSSNTLADIIGCSTAIADKCLCAGSN